MSPPPSALSSLDDLVFELDENAPISRIWTANDALLVVPRDELLGKPPRLSARDRNSLAK